jgi:acyl carrier protein
LSTTGSDRLARVVRDALVLDDEIDLDTAAYGKTEGWDSVGHMGLVSAIETEFGIEVEADDVVAMATYPAVAEILRSRYGLALVGPEGA